MLLIQSPQKTSVNLDWLSWSGYTDEPIETPICPSGLRLEVLKGTNVFEHRGILYNYKGAKMLTMLWKPKSNFNSKRLVQFEVANRWLYSQHLKEVINLAFMSIPHHFATLSRFDLAADFEGDERIKEIIRGILLGEIYVANKRVGSTWWNGELHNVHDLNFGSKSSDFKWKLYNKSLEIGDGDRCEKPYIRQLWEELEMRKDCDIWRLEVSVTKGSTIAMADDTTYKWVEKINKETGEIKEEFKPQQRLLTLDDITEGLTQWRVLMGLYDKRFQVRRNEGRVRKSNETRVDFLISRLAKTISLKKMESVETERETKAITECVRLVELIQSQTTRVNKNVTKLLCAALKAKVDEQGAHKYMNAVVGMPIDEWLERMIATAGQGVWECGN